MATFFSGLIVLSAIFYFIGILIIPFLHDALVPLFIFFPITIGIVSGIVLLIILIRERIQDKKEENKDDLSKF